jgi:hypothetical protein
MSLRLQTANVRYYLADMTPGNGTKRTLLRAALALGPILSLNSGVRVAECNYGAPSCRSKHSNEIDGRFCAAF